MSSAAYTAYTDVTSLIIIPYIECDNMIVDITNDNVQIVEKLTNIIAIMEHLKFNEESRMVDC
jgi:hypothetical protein